MKKIVGLLIVAGMLLTSSTGFATNKYHNLENEKGEVVYQTKSLKEMPVVKYSKDETKRMSKSHDLADQLLKNGSAALFYVVNNNPKGETDLRFKPFVFTDVAALRKKMKGQPLIISDKLIGKYTFKSATVFFDPITVLNPPTVKEQANIADKLRKEAKKSKKEYAMMPVELSDRFAHLTIQYAHGDEQISVSIMNHITTSIPTTYVDDQMKIEQEKIDGKKTDFLYTEYKENELKDIVWVAQLPDKKAKYVYSVRSSAPKITKKNLVKIAESYMK
ncbi:hypothetical protein I6N90_17130 [Paenibacillus sp. GSMTC-2017]|uniref:hypothetical protein n=1 Tax=Paenibacillus sp. GSMTC-2017 TaxID=2794350 RepID=UPI0018D7AB99|nr:hypothetical protein [Paenibacillus sp. GSMTC-2017]MBH5319522.1 hypothetical protein [Paenibacillus sp. GSMTC-2017]